MNLKFHTVYPQHYHGAKGVSLSVSGEGKERGHTNLL